MQGSIHVAVAHCRLVPLPPGTLPLGLLGLEFLAAVMCVCFIETVICRHLTDRTEGLVSNNRTLGNFVCSRGNAGPAT